MKYRTPERGRERTKEKCEFKSYEVLRKRKEIKEKNISRKSKKERRTPSTDRGGF